MGDAASKAAKKIRENPVCQKYTRSGSLSVSDSSLGTGCLPGRNFQTGVLDRWRETRGTERVMSFVTRPEASCYHCAMPCFNRVEVPAGKYKGLKISSGTALAYPIILGFFDSAQTFLSSSQCPAPQKSSYLHIPGRTHKLRA